MDIPRFIWGFSKMVVPNNHWFFHLRKHPYPLITYQTVAIQASPQALASLRLVLGLSDREKSSQKVLKQKSLKCLWMLYGAMMFTSYIYIYGGPPKKNKTMFRAKTVLFTVFHAHFAL